MKPTEAQKREFWEWCGVKQKEVPTSIMSDRVWETKLEYPPIDLNNLFKYAIKKFDGTYEGYQIEITGVSLCPSDVGWWCEVTYNWTEDGVFDHGRVDTDFKTHYEDPALALFWAIWEVIHD